MAGQHHPVLVVHARGGWRTTGFLSINQMRRSETLSGRKWLAFLKWIRAVTLNWLNQGEIACIVSDLWRAEEITNVKPCQWDQRDSLVQERCSAFCKQGRDSRRPLSSLQKLWCAAKGAKLRCFLKMTSILSVDAPLELKVCLLHLRLLLATALSSWYQFFCDIIGNPDAFPQLSGNISSVRKQRANHAVFWWTLLVFVLWNEHSNDEWEYILLCVMQRETLKTNSTSNTNL